MGIAITLGTSIVGGGSPNDILTALGATFAIDAGRSVADEQVAVNFGSGGAALNATYGSTGGVDTNDPLLLTHAGANYLNLPELSGNNATTPDAAALDVSTEVEMVVRVRYLNTSGTPALISKDQTTWAYGLQIIATSGQVRFRHGNDGTTPVNIQSNANLAYGTNVWFWLKVTWRASDGRTQFFHAADQAFEPTVWTQLGSDVTGQSGVNIPNNANPLYLGTRAGFADLLSGDIARAIVRGAIDGAPVLDANFTTNTNQSSFTESSSNAATVTINRTTTGRKAAMVTRPIWLFGTDDHLEVADNALIDFALADSFTVVAVVRNWATFGTNDAIVAKKANTTNTTAGWALTNHGTTAEQLAADVGDGAAGAEATSASRTSGALTVVSMVRNVGSDNITTYVNSTAGTPVTDATTATSANAEVMRIGRLSGAGTEYNDMEVVAVAVFPSALSAADIAAIVAYYGV